MKNRFLLLLFPLFLYSESLDEIVNLSIQNKLIQATQYNNKALVDSYQSTKNSYKPSLTIGSSYSDVKNETAMYPNNSLTSFATINYTIYDGGIKQEKFNSFKENIKGANKNLDALKNKISLNVIELYFHYLSSLSLKDAYFKQIQTLTTQKQRLEKFYQAGITTKDEIEKLESKVESVNVLIHETELNLETILHNLEYLTAKNINIKSGSTIKKTMLDKTNRADIQSLEHSVQSLKHIASMTKAKNNPMVTLDNTYYSYNNNYDNDAYDLLDDQNIFKVNVAWKIFDFDTTNKSYQSEYKKYLAVKSQYEYEKQKADVDYKLAKKAVVIANHKIRSAKLALKSSNSTFKIIEQKYKNGLVDNIAYLDALSSKYDAVAKLDGAKYELEIKKAQLIYHSGKNVWEYIK